MAGFETTIVKFPMATATTTVTRTNSPSRSTVRKFVGVRQRRSGRWVAEIKDSSQRIRLWLGTYDTPEEAARVYDEAARALRGDRARTNFSKANPKSFQLGSSNGGRGTSFSSLKSKIIKNLHGIMIRSSQKEKSSENRVSDHFTFASAFHLRNYCNPFYQSPIDTKSIENAVEPSLVVPHVSEDQYGSSYVTLKDSSNGELPDRFGFEPDQLDLGEANFLCDQLQGFGDEMLRCNYMEWVKDE